MLGEGSGMREARQSLILYLERRILRCNTFTTSEDHRLVSLLGSPERTIEPRAILPEFLDEIMAEKLELALAYAKVKTRRDDLFKRLAQQNDQAGN
jgi:hypothetical protein